MAFSLTSILPLPDMLALGWFFLCWVGYAWYADHRRWGTCSDSNPVGFTPLAQTQTPLDNALY